MNKAMIIGRLGQDPEMRYTSSGDPVCNFSVATSERYKDRAGEQKEVTEWHNVTAYGKPAEIINQYAKKGSQIYVGGKLKTDKWEKDGQTHYSTKIIIGFGGEFEFLGSKGDEQPASKPASQPARQAPPKEKFNDDIPF